MNFGDRILTIKCRLHEAVLFGILKLACVFVTCFCWERRSDSHSWTLGSDKSSGQWVFAYRRVFMADCPHSFIVSLCELVNKSCRRIASWRNDPILRLLLALAMCPLVRSLAEVVCMFFAAFGL